MQAYENFIDIVDAIRFRDWKVNRGTIGSNDWFVQVEFSVPDAKTGQPSIQQGRKWLIEPDASESQIVFTVWKAVETALEHEAREDFAYEGKRILNPHMDVQSMLRGRLAVDSKYRKEAT